MTGTTKAIAIILLALVTLVCLNVALYRRFRATLAEGRRRQAAEDPASDAPAIRHP